MVRYIIHVWRRVWISMESHPRDPSSCTQSNGMFFEKSLAAWNGGMRRRTTRDGHSRWPFFKPPSALPGSFLFRTCIDIEYLEWRYTDGDILRISDGRWWIIAAESTPRANENGVAPSRGKSFYSDRPGFTATWSAPISRVFRERCFPQQTEYVGVFLEGRRKNRRRKVLLPRRSKHPPSITPSFQLPSKPLPASRHSSS